MMIPAVRSKYLLQKIWKKYKSYFRHHTILAKELNLNQHTPLPKNSFPINILIFFYIYF
jgi:hypothetical protein